MTTWPQLYDPFDNWIVSTAVSALPVLTLFFVLVALKQRVWVSALSGLLVAVGLALWVFQMPAVLVATAAATWLHFRDDADRVDRRRLDLSLQHRLDDRTVSGDEGFDCGVVFGQAPATRADCLLLRRVPGRHGRRRRAGRHCRIVSHRARLQPVSSRDAVSRGQHRAGGVGRSRQSDSCARRA